MQRLAILVCALCVFARVHAAAQLPLIKGSSWIYIARVSWTTPGTPRVMHAVIHWNMQVLDALDSPHGRIAIVSGLPYQLGSYEPGMRPGLDVVVETANGMWSASAGSPSEARTLMKRLSTGEMTAGDQQYLENPIRTADCFGADDPARTDGFYCWKVLRKIRDRFGTGWEMTYRTLADRVTISYVPGIGITRYGYEHNGTVAMTSARLDAYHAAAK